MFYLDEFFNLPISQLLTIKLKNDNGFAYGKLSFIGGFTPQQNNDPQNSSKATIGRLQRFNNYEQRVKDSNVHPVYSTQSIHSQDVESIEIIQRED